MDPIAAPQVQELTNAARAPGMKVLVRDIRTADDLPAAFDAGAKEHVGQKHLA
jgi:putative ABC transport system substrate-binding protein